MSQAVTKLKLERYKLSIHVSKDLEKEKETT